MRKLFIAAAFLSLMSYLLYILSKDFMGTWIRTHSDDPWNDYASEEDDTRAQYKAWNEYETLADKVFAHQTRLDSHHDGSDIDVDIDDSDE